VHAPDAFGAGDAYVSNLMRGIPEEPLPGKSVLKFSVKLWFLNLIYVGPIGVGLWYFWQRKLEYNNLWLFLYGCMVIVFTYILSIIYSVVAIRHGSKTAQKYIIVPMAIVIAVALLAWGVTVNMSVETDF